MRATRSPHSGNRIESHKRGSPINGATATTIPRTTSNGSRDISVSILSIFKKAQRQGTMERR